MVRTRVGYAGGTTADPTYENIGDHAETIEVEFDPATISYDELLEVFWNAHDPSYRSLSRQYRAAIFLVDDGQQRSAESSRDRVALRVPRGVGTAVEALYRFYPAEDYHQKYYLRSVKPIAEAFHRAYPDETAFAGSTAAARVNGYLGGHGGPAQLAEQIGGLGLDGEAREALEKIVGQMHPSEGCPVPSRPARKR